MVKNKIIKLLPIILLIIIFFWLRLWRIEDRVNFSMDQGMFMLRAREIWDNKELTLLGPSASPTINGRHFFQGPAIYYSLVALGLIGNWDPINISVVLVSCGLIGMYFLFKTITLISSEKSAWVGALIYCFLPVTIEFSNFIWNPNFLLFLTPVFLYLYIRSIGDNHQIWSVLSGILAGICLQFHFQFLPVLGLSCIYLVYKNKKLLLPYLFGIIIGYLPLIIFDLRNNFYNVGTILEWIFRGSDSKLGFTWHYVLTYIVLLIIPFSVIVGKFNIYLKMLFLIGLILTGIGRVDKIITNGLDYKSQDIVVGEIVRNGCPKDFNIASTVDGDTRAYNLRYLLTINNCSPMAVDEYPKAKTLFLIAPPERPPEKETVWEVSSLGKFKIKNTIQINPNVIFYELGF